VRQIDTTKLFPELCAALDKLSLATQHPAYCRECGRTMVSVNAQLWTYGGDQEWKIKLAFCAKCDCEAIEAVPVGFAA
jgi:hypothetical protein